MIEWIIDIAIYLILGFMIAHDFRKLGSGWLATVTIFLFYPLLIILSMLIVLFDLARTKLKRK